MTTEAPAAPAAAPSAPAAPAPSAAPKPSRSAAPSAPAAPKAPVLDSTGTGDAGGSDRGMADATRSFRRGGKPAPEPAATADLETDADTTQDAATEPAEPPADESEITDKAYQFDSEDDAGSGDPAEAPESAAPDESLSILEATFGIKKGAATPEHLAGIIKDVEDTVATVRRSKSEQAASPPAATDNQARPQNPASASSAAPAPKAEGKPEASGSELPALLSEDDLRELGEYSPAHANIGKTLNQVLSLLSKAQAPDKFAALEKRLTGIERTREYEAGMQVVGSFVEHQVKQGLPAIPQAEQADFLTEVEDYLRGRQQSGKPLTPDQALQAVYMRRTGSQIQQKAAQAKEEGRQEVVRSLEKRQRKFDLAGGPGSVSGAPRGDESKNAIQQATRQFRKGLAAG